VLHDVSPTRIHVTLGESLSGRALDEVTRARAEFLLPRQLSREEVPGEPLEVELT
jgi:hypothetical protein